MPMTSFPRVRFAHLPTPLEPLEALTRALGGPGLWVKRDDATGLALGGNKTRKLEFLIAEAKTEGADTVISTGGVQSNHVRQTAAAAARCGLRCELVLTRVAPWDAPDYEETGNVLLDRILGAGIQVLAGATDRASAMAEVAERVRARGGKPYVIPTGGSNTTGALGYVNCALEIEAKAKAMGLTVAAVVHAASSGGTQAGLVAGFHAIHSRTRVIGIDVDANAESTRAAAAHLTRAVAERIGGPVPPDDAVAVEPGYAGEAYGLPTPEMTDAVKRLGRLEGLILDPVYSGKAMAALIDLVAHKRFETSDTVVFLHTGGAPALFAYRSAFDGTD